MVDASSISLTLWNDGAAAPLFVRAARDQLRLKELAAKACRASKMLDAFTAQFARLLSALNEWLNENHEKIKAAHLTVRERDLLFLVVQNDARFNAELTDSLTELDLSIANGPEFELIDLEVLAIPPLSTESLRAVLSIGTVLHDAQ